jgi:hypothetical protein
MQVFSPDLIKACNMWCVLWGLWGVLAKYFMRIKHIVDEQATPARTPSPQTPDQQRLAALRRQRDNASAAIKAEQQRQKKLRLQQQQQRVQQQLQAAHTANTGR